MDLLQRLVQMVDLLAEAMSSIQVLLCLFASGA
jgi:hypothetical protein